MIEQKRLEKFSSKMYIISMIANTLSMLIWGGLAIFFEKWWITLFSILFIQMPKNTVQKVTE